MELYGIGVSIPATIFIGACRQSNVLSVILALISEATEPLLHASLTIISLPVFLTEFTTVSISRGTSVLGSITSQLMPSLSSSSAASSDLITIFEYAKMVISSPFLLISAFPNGMVYSSSGTGLLTG